MATANWWDDNVTKIKAVDVPQQNTWQYRNPNPYYWYESEATNIPGRGTNWWKGTGVAGKEKLDKKAYQSLIDKWSTLSTGWRAQSPTRYTPQLEEGLMNTLAGTAAEQNAKTNEMLNSQFNQRGLYGQGVHQAAMREAAQGQAAKTAQQATELSSQIANQRYEDYVRWWQDSMARKDQEWQKAYQQYMAQLQSSAMGDGGQGSSFDWMSMIAPGAKMLGI